MVISFDFNLSFCNVCLCRDGGSCDTDRSLIKRHDSTLSAMRCLLESSQEGSPSKDDSNENSPATTHVSETSTPESSQASTEASQTDDCSTSTISGRPSPVTPTSEMPTPTPESQTASDEEAGALLSHKDHASEVMEQAKERVSLKTRRPCLWRHGYEIFESICTYNGVLVIFS